VSTGLVRTRWHSLASDRKRAGDDVLCVARIGCGDSQPLSAMSRTRGASTVRTSPVDCCRVTVMLNRLSSPSIASGCSLLQVDPSVRKYFRLHRMHGGDEMQTIVTDRQSRCLSASLSVCQSATRLNSASLCKNG